MYHKLLKHGIKVNLKLVQRLMNEMGLFSIVVKKWRATKNSAIDNRNFPNLLGQDFAAISPNQKWAADMTYIYTKRDGWCYLATIQDLYSRKIIAHQALFSYIEGFYNRRRIHGGINYKTPNEMELIAV